MRASDAVWDVTAARRLPGITSTLALNAAPRGEPVGGADRVGCRDSPGGQLDADRGRVLPQVGGA